MPEAPGPQGGGAKEPEAGPKEVCGPRAVSMDCAVTEPKLKALSKLAETQLLDAPGFRHAARIGSACVALLTNNEHLLAFWRANWFSAEADARPDATVYAVTGVEKREPGIFSNPAVPQAVVFNSDYYGHVRYVALALAREAIEEAGGVLVSAAAVGVRQRGAILVAGASDAAVAQCALSLCRLPGARLQAMNVLALLPGEKGAVFQALENAFYLPGRLAKEVEELGELSGRVPGEDIVTELDACTNEACLKETQEDPERCILQQDAESCLWAQPTGALLVDAAYLNKTYERCRSMRVLGLIGVRQGETETDAPELEVAGPSALTDVLQHCCAGKQEKPTQTVKAPEQAPLSTTPRKRQGVLKKLVEPLPCMRLTYSREARVPDPETLLEDLVAPVPPSQEGSESQ